MSNQPLAHNKYKPIHSNTRVASYFYLYIIYKYYITHEDGGVLDNPYSLQVLHINEDGVLLGTTIQDYQREIPLI